MDRLPHEKLEAWRKRMPLVKTIYEITKKFQEKKYSVSPSGCGRAAVSIPSKLAEGAARIGQKEYAHFISIAVARWRIRISNYRLPICWVITPNLKRLTKI